LNLLRPCGEVFKLNKPDVVYKHIHRTRRPPLSALGEMMLEARPVT